jgi:hypothetical protein
MTEPGTLDDRAPLRNQQPMAAMPQKYPKKKLDLAT